ncbi:MAG: PAS domain-containing protein [Thalassobaculaceae bacterium]
MIGPDRKWVPIQDLAPPSASLVHRNFLAHWLNLRGENVMPSFSDIDPVNVPWALAYIFVVDALPDGDFVYRIAGSEIEDRYNRSLKGARVSEIMQAAGTRSILQRWAAVRDTPAGFYVESSHFSESGRIVEGERIVLPLGNDRLHTTHLIGITRFHSPSTLNAHLLGDQQVRSIQWASLVG